MAPPTEANLRRRLLLLDAAAIVVAWSAVLALVDPPTSPGWRLLVMVTVPVGMCAMWVGLLGLNELYLTRVCANRTIELARLLRVAVTCVVVLLTTSAITGTHGVTSAVFVGSGLCLGLLTVTRGAFGGWLRESRRHGRFHRRILVLGSGAGAREITRMLWEHPELGFTVAGTLGNEPVEDAEWLGSLRELDQFLPSSNVSGAIICGHELPPEGADALARRVLAAGTHVHVATGLKGVAAQRLRPQPFAYETLLYVEPRAMRPIHRHTKRAVDVVLASLLLTFVGAPLLLAAAVAIRLDDGEPIIFRQRRVGLNGVPFVMYKLRTMRIDAEDARRELLQLNYREGPLFKAPFDPRITRVGRFLRATSIDELPQLWNVLNGTMSLVGPRPALEEEVLGFDARLRERELMSPGMTGLWQVEARDNPSFVAYARYDLFYVENWSLALDVALMLRTAAALALRACRLSVTLGPASRRAARALAEVR